MLFKSQKKVQAECEKEYNNMEAILLAHGTFKRKLYIQNTEGYNKYEEKIGKIAVISDIIDKDIVNPFMKNYEKNRFGFVKPCLTFTAVAGVCLGVGLGLQIAVPDHPIWALIAGGGFELAAIPFICKVVHKFRRANKFDNQQINNLFRWQTLRYIPTYTEGFMRVNNIEITDVFEESALNMPQLKREMKALHDPLVEDEETRRKIKRFLKIAHLEDECEI